MGDDDDEVAVNDDDVGDEEGGNAEWYSCGGRGAPSLPTPIDFLPSSSFSSSELQRSRLGILSFQFALRPSPSLLLRRGWDDLSSIDGRRYSSYPINSVQLTIDWREAACEEIDRSSYSRHFRGTNNKVPATAYTWQKRLLWRVKVRVSFCVCPHLILGVHFID